MLEFWDYYFKILLKQQFLPYISGVFITEIYLYRVLTKEEMPEESINGYFMVQMLGLLTMVFVGYFVYHEIRTLRSADSVLEHLKSIWNINDVFWMILTPFIVIVTLP